jgi:hypothetical protein
MKVSTENDNHFGYEKITILVDNIPLSNHNDITEILFKVALSTIIRQIDWGNI